MRQTASLEVRQMMSKRQKSILASSADFDGYQVSLPSSTLHVAASLQSRFDLTRLF
jgi:hypothetical protein